MKPSTAFDAVTWPVETARLAIRPATSADLDATWRFRRLASVAEWVGTHPSRIEEYAEQFDRPERLASTLVVELDGQVIGDLMLEIQDGWSQSEVAEQGRGVQAELGWTLDPEHGRHGYATEAVAELVRICFEELGLRRVIALCFADNDSSRRLMERLGMRREGHALKESLHRTRGWVDSYTYALLADEWRAAQV